MAKASEQFRASDVTLWGIIALCCWGGAVLLAKAQRNLAALESFSAILANSVLR